MNPKDKELVESILVKNPEDLSIYEVAVLNARRDYLNNEQKRVFASVLRPESPLVAVETPVVQPVQEAVPPVLPPAETTYMEVPESVAPIVEPVQEAEVVQPIQASNPFDVNPEESLS